MENWKYDSVKHGGSTEQVCLYYICEDIKGESENKHCANMTKKISNLRNGQ